MIGCILTGHGSFAPGLMGALEMIAGEQQRFEVIPFLEGASLEVFEADISKAVRQMAESCEGVIVFTDITGGTPFRAAMLAAGGIEAAEVISGTNLPMLIEGGLLRGSFTDAGELADMLVNSGSNAVTHAKLELKEDEITDEEEGI